jgi:hypothetical protein
MPAPDWWESARFLAFSWLTLGSAKVALSRPAHQRVTQTVSPLNAIPMQTLRHFLYLIIVVACAMVLSACSARQLNDNVSTTLPPVHLVASPSHEPNTLPIRTPSDTRTPRIEGGTPIPFSTYTPTPTLDLASYANTWTRYHGNYGISFEYPSIYDEKPYNDRCKAVESWDGADFGEKNEVYVRQPLGPTLDEHVELSLANYHREKPLTIESRAEIEINKRPAIVIKYKLVEESESREFVFTTVLGSELIYTFSFIGGSACDIPEISLSERTVFEHAFATFYYQE